MARWSGSIGAVSDTAHFFETEGVIRSDKCAKSMDAIQADETFGQLIMDYSGWSVYAPMWMTIMLTGGINLNSPFDTGDYIWFSLSSRCKDRHGCYKDCYRLETFSAYGAYYDEFVLFTMTGRGNSPEEGLSRACRTQYVSVYRADNRSLYNLAYVRSAPPVPEIMFIPIWALNSF